MLCANCGRELEERGCKVRCKRCGYFEDCSDPSAPGDWDGVETGSASGAATPAAMGATTPVDNGAEMPAADSLHRRDGREADR